MREIFTKPGEIPGLFQFDCDELPTVELGSWLIQQLDGFVWDNQQNFAEYGVNLFNCGKRMICQTMLWLEPGYFLNVSLTFSFTYEIISRINGKDIAPFQVHCETRFQLSTNEDCAFAGSLRFDNSHGVNNAVKLIGSTIVLMAMDKFLSEVITEQ